MSNIYVNLIDNDSDEGRSASEEDYRIEVNDDHEIDSTVAPPIPIVIAPATTPKKRVRKALKAVTEARLSALYHGASSIENKESNGTSESFVGAEAFSTPKKRGRPRKPESEKNSQRKGLLRINIGPKSKLRKTEASSPNEESPFPLVQQAVKTVSVKKSRGRPRIHPPKDPSMKRPRGRPRSVPLVGEQGYKSEYLKMKRECAKKDALIERLTQYLTDLGHSVDDILRQADNNSQSNDDSGEKSNANESAEEVVEMVEINNIEHSNQKYIGMFVEDNDKDKEEDSD